MHLASDDSMERIRAQKIYQNSEFQNRCQENWVIPLAMDDSGSYDVEKITEAVFGKAKNLAENLIYLFQ
jgi:hypothetical protein